MTGEEEVLCRDVNGVLHRVRLAERGPFATPGSMLEQRLVTGPNDATFLRKSVPAEAGRRERRLYDLLDNEIRVIAHLTRVIGGRCAELPTLVGYNVDVEEPFVLLRPYLGQPATEVVRALDPDRQREFQVGMLRVLHLIAGAGVVHGALSLDSLRWNGTTVQLVDFERAQLAGEPRHTGSGPWQSPERLHGVGLTDARDDVWSAAVLIRELVLGPQALAAPADQAADPERLRQRLGRVFQPVDQRPSAAELLSAMTRRAVPPVRLADPRSALAEGYRMFDEARGRKGVPPPAGPPHTPPPNGRRGWRRLLGGGQ
ncbi:hypothetical protein [Paractinoplanes rishiriensis]|uniref:Protein kinase domain-containing protein n=1 Tax=Paractinoplanes rishiriensis TaxID=1050105 RepID=A0A919JWM3_9ACTN|nr:hypothetical protein [Actinoplanes rishiriensis]GIE94624.1 hypothetical protein Ari01nite_20890 [Actinoplanes rishiriensis]